MRKKEEKVKLGRPKLADSKTKKKATIYIAIAFALLMAFTMGGIYSLYGSFSANKLNGKIINDECTKYWKNKHICPNMAGNYGYKCTAHRNNWNNTVTNCVQGKATRYRVVYSKNDKYATGTMNDQYITHGVNTKLSTNKFYNQGRKFKGWWAKRTSDNKWYGVNKKGELGWFNYSDIKTVKFYPNGQTVAKTVAPGDTVIMHAQWDYTTTQVTKKTTKQVQAQKTTAKTTKKTTAKTTKNNKYFIVKFNANGGTGSMNDQSIMHGNYNNNKLTPLSQNRFSRNGYKFTGWRAKRLVDGKWYGYNSSNEKGWYTESSIKKFNVYKDKQGVSRTVAPGDTVMMYAQWQAIPKTQSKTASKTCSSIKDQKTCTSSTQGEWKYSCIWKQNACYAGNAQAYKVVYNKNSKNATGTMNDQYITYGVNTKLRKNAFTLNGYKFAGWRAVNNKNGYVYGKNKDGKNGWYNSTDLKTVNFYKNQTTVSQTAAKGETVTMYAQWKVDSNQNSAINSTSFKIEKSSTKKNCFNVYAPKDAKYWRVHVYYKSAGSSSYGKNKIYSKNHYSDGAKLQEVCFNKGYGDYRILVKKTTGSNDTASGSPSSWKPSGASVNNSIGWAYKDYNGYNPK